MILDVAQVNGHQPKSILESQRGKARVSNKEIRLILSMFDLMKHCLN